LEREGMPLNIASVAVFDGVISLADCIEFVGSKLPLIPRYYQRVVVPPLNIGLPMWEYDPEFDIGNHVREVMLKRGTDADLKAAASKILSVTMDRRHPLWDITLMRGLKGNRTGMVVRAHHCLADGVAGVALMNVLMDPQPISHAPAKRAARVHAPPPRDAGTLLVDGLMNSYSSLVQQMLAMQAEVLDLAQKAIAGAPQWSLPEVNRLLPELSAPTQRLPFNTVCHGPQRFAWGEIPMAQIKAIREVTGATVNDVVITVVTLALRRYAELLGAKVKGRLLKIAVPVNMRGNGHPDDLGNRISFLPVAVPLDVRSPRKLLAAVHQRMQFLKNAHAAQFVSLAGTLLGTILPPLQALAGPVASQLPISLCNTICTNVPGPQVPLYLLGHEMLCWYPYVPIGGEMGLNCAMLSYNGAAYFGFTGDVQAAPHLRHLERFLSLNFAELQKAVRVGSQRPRRPPKNKVVSLPKPVAKEEEVVLAASA
ncbi:MAG TPA: wax ester/triacylglycerol synthase family O-acyltransferase, partial [Nitrospiria bacterium]|nr:wax ester/triacylglycerol synthase family O-acyltransferase [Nitrospiria bacterium]